MFFSAIIAHLAPVLISLINIPIPSLPGISPAPQQSDTAPQRSGIIGTVTRLSGNHMPAPNRRTYPSNPNRRIHPSNPDSPAQPSTTRPDSTRGVKATICIFQLTSDRQVIPRSEGSPYYRTVLTRLVRQVDTDENGYFQVILPPGTYSVFTKKGDWFYATRRDEKNNIAPVEVLPGKMTRVQCSVESDHKVVY